ncbi:hypothetical protein Vadar_019769 [Vaccinium darrowii]|uniref:Uncharacterized protein n=1 Tax=Vaccinium darrowii TaxID=229202 RepID=A0ACB7YYZ0_9ERIC|nr:hypothetical protein Vadar_019769 [Vaccinium darrowii]
MCFDKLHFDVFRLLFLNNYLLPLFNCYCTLNALNKIKASLGWRVVYSWVGDDPCGDGDLPPWSGVTCSTLGYYRVVTELEVYAVSIVGPLDYSFMTPTKHEEERGSWREDAKLTTMAVSMVELTKMVQMVAELRNFLVLFDISVFSLRRAHRKCRRPPASPWEAATTSGRSTVDFYDQFQALFHHQMAIGPT